MTPVTVVLQRLLDGFWVLEHSAPGSGLAPAASQVTGRTRCPHSMNHMRPCASCVGDTWCQFPRLTVRSFPPGSRNLNLSPEQLLHRRNVSQALKWRVFLSVLKAMVLLSGVYSSQRYRACSSLWGGPYQSRSHTVPEGPRCCCLQEPSVFPWEWGRSWCSVSI